jgi:hypothetical protein
MRASSGGSDLLTARQADMFEDTGRDGRQDLVPGDFRRAKTQGDRIRLYMLWRNEYLSLFTLRMALGGSDTGNSALLRALRKKGLALDCKKIDGEFQYRVRYREEGER